MEEFVFLAFTVLMLGGGVVLLGGVCSARETTWPSYRHSIARDNKA